MSSLASPPLFLSFLSFLLFLRCHISAATAAGNKPPAYEVLQSYNFPVGLLPAGVLDYELNSATGDFKAYLNATCSFSLQGSYQLKYQPTISGRITAGRLDKLKGVGVKVLLFWLDIVSVVRSGDQLHFSVGLLSASFDVDQFYESPQCGCGFDCVNAAGVAAGEEEEGSLLDILRPGSSPEIDRI